MVLLQLMNVKTPITDADCIRTLACKALAGLARSDTVRQIVSKLPMFTNGQLQSEFLKLIWCFSVTYLMYFNCRFDEGSNLTRKTAGACYIPKACFGTIRTVIWENKTSWS